MKKSSNMTAETLKPFITPQNVESCPTSGVTTTRRQRNFNILAIGLSTISLILLTAVLGYTIWLSTRVFNTETENARLNRVIGNLQKRLGLNYLDDMENFEKGYTNALIEDPSSLDDLEGDYDDEDDEDIDDDKSIAIVNVNKDNNDNDDDDSDEYGKLETYDEIQEYIRKINGFEEDNDDEDDDDDDEDVDEVTVNNQEDSSNASEDDNLYVDFEKYKDSKKKKENARSTRSIKNLSNEFPFHETTYTTQSNDTKNEEQIKQNTNGSAAPKYRTQLPSDPSRSSTLKKTLFVADKTKTQRYTPLRPRSHRQRKIPVVKSGESLLSAKNINPANQMSSMALNSIKPAAHFHLNRKVPERHGAIRVDSYPGDMYIGHHPSWSNEVATEHYFSIQNGVLTVREPGLYYVYAQICYNNTHDQNGFVIFHGHKPFLQCLNTVPTNLPLKIHTCHTSGLIYLLENETIHLRDFHSDRNVILKDSNNRSYFGLIKV